MLFKLSKKKLWIIFSAALIFVLVLMTQFIALTVLRGRNDALNLQLNGLQDQIAGIPSDIGVDAKLDEARWEYGYQYPDERTLEEAD